MKLEIDGLGKTYSGKVQALQDFTMTVGVGVLGLLGPNGAGKSTLMRILATVTRPTAGRASWNEHDIVSAPNRVRRILGYLPQDFGIYPNLNAEEFLTYLAAARGLTGQDARSRIQQLLALVNLGDARKRRLSALSGGMKQRVGIAQALLNDPQLLIVDEPTAGLDPEERIRFRNLLSELSGERVVILSSHIVSDLEAAASSIAIMNRGRLLVHAEPEALLSTVQDQVWEVVIPSSELTALKNERVVSSTTRTPAGVRARVVGARPAGVEAKPLSPTLEDAYLVRLSADNGNAPHE